MNVYSNLMANKPINFYNVCVMYPLTVSDMIDEFNTENSKLIFQPFLLTHSILDDSLKDMSMFDIIFKDNSTFQLMLLGIMRICKCDISDLTLTKECEIKFNKFDGTLNKNNFDEFSNIIADMLYIDKKKIKKKEDDIPKFETEDGRKRWEHLQEMRKKYAPKVNGTELNNMYMYAQFGGDYYIPDKDILNWTYWKLVYSQEIISNKSTYDTNLLAVLQGADKKIIKKHWTKEVYK